MYQIKKKLNKILLITTKKAVLSVVLDDEYTYRSFAMTSSQLKMRDFSGELFKGYEVL